MSRLVRVAAVLGSAMTFKEKVEDHPAIVVLTVAATAFFAGVALVTQLRDARQPSVNNAQPLVNSDERLAEELNNARERIEELERQLKKVQPTAPTRAPSERMPPEGAPLTSAASPRITSVALCAPTDQRTRCVALRESRGEQAQRPIYVIVSFADADADTSVADFAIVGTEPANLPLTVQAGLVNESAAQKAGAEHVATWYCGGAYTVMIRMSLQDRRGNRSGYEDFQIDCRPYFA
jgi:hypothetical protein